MWARSSSDGQVAHVASLEALVSLPDSEDAEEIEFDHVVSAAEHLHYRLKEKKRQLLDQGDLDAFKRVDARCKESLACWQPFFPYCTSNRSARTPLCRTRSLPITTDAMTRLFFSS